MFILFSLIFMRMSGAIIFNPLLGRTNFPNPAKGALIFVLSLMLYMGVDGTLAHKRTFCGVCAGIFHGTDVCGDSVCLGNHGPQYGSFHGAGI